MFASTHCARVTTLNVGDASRDETGELLGLDARPRA